MLSELNTLFASTRLLEVKSIGTSSTDVIDGYGKCVDIGNELLSKIDYKKIETYKDFSIKNIIYTQGIGIIGGIISGILGTVLYNSFI